MQGLIFKRTFKPHELCEQTRRDTVQIPSHALTSASQTCDVEQDHNNCGAFARILNVEAEKLSRLPNWDWSDYCPTNSNVL